MFFAMQARVEVTNEDRSVALSSFDLSRSLGHVLHPIGSRAIKAHVSVEGADAHRSVLAGSLIDEQVYDLATFCRKQSYDVVVQIAALVIVEAGMATFASLAFPVYRLNNPIRPW